MPERILVVLPFYGGSLPVGRYCVTALQGNGCLVDVFEAPLFHGGLEAFKSLNIRQDRLDFLENSYLNLVGDALLAQVERFQPDLVLCLAQAPLSRKTLRRLSHDGVATAMWFVEDYQLFTYWRAFAPLYDFFAVIQQEPFLSELKAIGVENALYLPLAALPGLHRPLHGNATGVSCADGGQAGADGSGKDSMGGEALTEADRLRFSADFSFMGAGYPNRRLAFRRLAALAAQEGLDFRIWGTEWEGEPQLEKHLRLKGMRISPIDAVRIFNAAKINLNLHSSVRPEAGVVRGDFVNPRTFEIAACGAFQLVDERGLLPELFAAGELATFSHLDELAEKIRYYLNQPEERRRIAEQGRERVLSDHTYQKRMQSLLDFIRKCRPGWQADQSGGTLSCQSNGTPSSLSGGTPLGLSSSGSPDKNNGTPLDPHSGGAGGAYEAGNGWPADLPPELRADLEKLRLELQLPPSPDFDSMIAALRSRSGRLDSLECALLFLDEWRKQYRR